MYCTYEEYLKFICKECEIMEVIMKKLDKCVKLMGLSLLILLNNNLLFPTGIFGINTFSDTISSETMNIYNFLNGIGFIVFIAGFILMIKEMIGYLLHWFKN